MPGQRFAMAMVATGLAVVVAPKTIQSAPWAWATAVFITIASRKAVIRIMKIIVGG